MSKVSSNTLSARIGMVNFINTAPIYEIWLETVNRSDWRVTEAAPTELNRLLYAGDLDLGFISSHEYAAHPDRYQLLDGLSISATGQVGSVFLFSRVPPEKLEGCRVFLSAQSQTSVSLLAIILETFHQVVPKYQTGAIADADIDQYDAVLAIGDEALRLSEQADYTIRLDLGEAWYNHTGLPFVFAVWAVRSDFFSSDRDTVTAVHQELLRCRDTGLGDLSRISSQVARRIPMHVETCIEYLQGIEYDLNEGKQKGLSLFIQYLIERGEAEPSSLPLKICRCNLKR